MSKDSKDDKKNALQRHPYLSLMALGGVAKKWTPGLIPLAAQSLDQADKRNGPEGLHDQSTVMRNIRTVGALTGSALGQGLGGRNGNIVGGTLGTALGHLAAHYNLKALEAKEKEEKVASLGLALGSSALLGGALYGGYQGYKHSKEVYPEEASTPIRTAIGAIGNIPTGFIYSKDRKKQKDWNTRADSGLVHSDDAAVGHTASLFDRPFDSRMHSNDEYKKGYRKGAIDSVKSNIEESDDILSSFPHPSGGFDYTAASNFVSNIDKHPRLKSTLNSISLLKHNTDFDNLHPQHVKGIVTELSSHPAFHEVLSDESAKYREENKVEPMSTKQKLLLGGMALGAIGMYGAHKYNQTSKNIAKIKKEGKAKVNAIRQDTENIKANGAKHVEKIRQDSENWNRAFDAKVSKVNDIIDHLKTQDVDKQLDKLKSVKEIKQELTNVKPPTREDVFNIMRDNAAFNDSRNKKASQADDTIGKALLAAGAAGALYGGYQGYRHGKEVHPEDKAHIGRALAGAILNAPGGYIFQRDRKNYKKWNAAADAGIPHSRDWSEGNDAGALDRKFDPRMTNNKAYSDAYGSSIKDYKASIISSTHMPTRFAYGDSYDIEDDFSNIDHHPELVTIADKVSKSLHGKSFSDVHAQHIPSVIDCMLDHPDYQKYLFKMHNHKLKNKSMSRIASSIDDVSSQLRLGNARETTTGVDSLLKQSSEEEKEKGMSAKKKLLIGAALLGTAGLGLYGAREYMGQRRQQAKIKDVFTKAKSQIISNIQPVLEENVEEVKTPERYKDILNNKLINSESDLDSYMGYTPEVVQSYKRMMDTSSDILKTKNDMVDLNSKMLGEDADFISKTKVHVKNISKQLHDLHKDLGGKDASIADLMEGAKKIYRGHVKSLNVKKTDTKKEASVYPLLAGGIVAGALGVHKKPLEIASRAYHTVVQTPNQRSSVGFLNHINDNDY